MKIRTILFVILFACIVLAIILTLIRKDNLNNVIPYGQKQIGSFDLAQPFREGDYSTFEDKSRRFEFEYPFDWIISENRQNNAAYVKNTTDYDWFEGVDPKEAEALARQYGVSYFSLKNPYITMDSYNFPLEIFVINNDWIPFFEIYQKEGLEYSNVAKISDNLENKINTAGSNYNEFRVKYDFGSILSARYYIFKLKDNGYLILKTKSSPKSNNNESEFEKLINSVKIYP